MAKPFSIQAPEDIAKEYAGNKQKIAQAAQMGTIDPTAAVLAGMFIDRMRSAQVMEGAQQPTVAQQVLGGVPPQGAGAPPPPPMGAPQDMAPPMGAPMAPPPMAPPPQDMAPPPPEMDMVPQGMADGGLAMLPVPDTMFDEPTNGGFDDGYAGGGMVAFADGGSASGGFGDYIEQMARKIDPNIQIAGRARTPARNAQVGGVAGSYHLIDAARDISVPPGMNKPQFIAQLKSVFGPDYDVLPSKGNSVHVEPGPKLGEKVRAGARPSGAPTVAPERDMGTAEGRSRSVDDEFENLQRRFGPTEKQKEIEDQRMARAEEMASPEYYEAQRKDSMWETLASIGFNMASSKSPYLLQAVGEAAAAAMPGARADKKERKALKDRALDIMGDINDKSRKENLQLYGIAVDIAKEGMQQEQFEKKMELDERQVAVAEKNLNEQIRQANLTKPEDINDTVTRYLLVYPPGSPQHEAAKRVYAARNPSSTTNTVDPKAIVEAGRQGAGGFSEGQTAKDTKGRTIVFQGGQWVYP